MKEGEQEPAVGFSEADDLRVVRRFVRERALAAGLAAERVELLTLAVSELVTNALQHARSGGSVRVWAEPEAVVCEVEDQGELQRRPRGAPMPAPDAVRGRGWAIVERVCDAVSLSAVGSRTVVRLRMRH